jgi:hypothetical protein
MGEHGLVGHLRQAQQLVVVELEHQRNFVCVLARDRAQHAIGGTHRVAATLDGQLDDVLGVEVRRVRSKRRTGRMLNALVDGKNAHIASTAQAACVHHGLKVAEDRWAAVGIGKHTIDEVCTWQMQR